MALWFLPRIVISIWYGTDFDPGVSAHRLDDTGCRASKTPPSRSNLVEMSLIMVPHVSDRQQRTKLWRNSLIALTDLPGSRVLHRLDSSLS
jgi:hypothetical protein